MILLYFKVLKAKWRWYKTKGNHIDISSLYPFPSLYFDPSLLLLSLISAFYLFLWNNLTFPSSRCLFFWVWALIFTFSLSAISCVGNTYVTVFSQIPHWWTPPVLQYDSTTVVMEMKWLTATWVCRAVSTLLHCRLGFGLINFTVDFSVHLSI